ncbi:polymeric immunoglobulin receptor-like isoform X2 [Oreochromis aureus]|uniref:polymeric immunoglobulin receptor-like isoform X2 n=1 Tax=Oreochromis aureus TaxID=47969 RepID=UPI001952DEA0|nr:polymeric immunoglobulin receptor-like isoform X2 [Oreochromis aureus]
MKVHHTLICFFFLSLQDGNPEVTNAQILSYGVIGGNVTVPLVFQSSGTWKMFCREDCEGENILIKTTDVRAQTGRYSIEYKRESTVYVLSVSISKLTESDSGQYSCGLGGSSSSASYERFGVFVAEALLDGNDDPAQMKHFNKETGSSLTVGCSFKQPGNRKMFCRGECGGENILVETRKVKAQRDRYNIRYGSGVLYVSITQLTKSDSGRYTCYLSGSSREFEVTVTDSVVSTTAQSFTSISRSFTPSPASTGTTEQSGQSQSERTSTGGVSGTQTSSQTAADVLLSVGLTLAVTIIIISVAVLISCKKRSSKVKDPFVEILHTAITDDEDNSRTVMNVSDKAFGFLNSAPYSHTNEVIYSVPREAHYENWTPTCAM